MNKSLVAVALVAVAATSTSFSLSYWAACRHRAHATALGHGFQDVSWLKHELDLTDTQMNEVGKLEKNLSRQLESLCTTHCAERFALGEELAQPVPDAEKARAHLERMNAIQAEAERVAFAHILQVRTLLNNDQGRRYGAMIHDQVCSICPLGLHSKAQP